MKIGKHKEATEKSKRVMPPKLMLLAKLFIIAILVSIIAVIVYTAVSPDDSGLHTGDAVPSSTSITKPTTPSGSTAQKSNGTNNTAQNNPSSPNSSTSASGATAPGTVQPSPQPTSPVSWYVEGGTNVGGPGGCGGAGRSQCVLGQTVSTDVRFSSGVAVTSCGGWAQLGGGSSVKIGLSAVVTSSRTCRFSFTPTQYAGEYSYNITASTTQANAEPSQLTSINYFWAIFISRDSCNVSPGYFPACQY